MGLFSKAKDNYDNRRDIAEYNYKAREYISEGQRIYEEEYNKLQEACWKTERKVNDYQRYKKDVLNEINRTLKSINSQHQDYYISDNVDFIKLDACAVRQEEKLDIVDKALATWVAPSLKDFVTDSISSELSRSDAKYNMMRARRYKDMMKTKRDEMRNTKSAVQDIPNFIYEEKAQIEQLMEKFRKTANNIAQNNSQEKTESLCQIAKLIADSMTTQFIDNNYQITEQYNAISKQFKLMNDRMANATWMLGD